MTRLGRGLAALVAFLLVGCTDPVTDPALVDASGDVGTDGGPVGGACPVAVLSDSYHPNPTDYGAMGMGPALAVGGDTVAGGWVQRQSGLTNFEHDAVVARFDGDGTLQWSVVIGDDVHDETVVALLDAPGQSDGVMAVIDRGEGSSGNGNTAWLVTLDASGTIVSETFVPALRPVGAVRRSDGSLVLAGDAWNLYAPQAGTVVGLDASLNEQWRRHLWTETQHDDAEVRLSGVSHLALAGDTPVVAGTVNRGQKKIQYEGERGMDIVLAGLDEDGRVAWQHELGADCDDAVISLHGHGDEVLMLAYVPGAWPTEQINRPVLAAVGEAGVRWARPLPDAEVGNGSMSRLASGDIVLSGQHPGQGNADGWVAVLDSDGELRTTLSLNYAKQGGTAGSAVLHGDQIHVVASYSEPTVAIGGFGLTRVEAPACAPGDPRNAPTVGPLCGEVVGAADNLTTSWRPLCDSKNRGLNAGSPTDTGSLPDTLCAAAHWLPRHLPEPWSAITPAYRLEPRVDFGGDVGIGVQLSGLAMQEGWGLMHDADDSGQFVFRSNLAKLLGFVDLMGTAPSSGAFLVARNLNDDGLLEPAEPQADGAMLAEQKHCGRITDLAARPDGGIVVLCETGDLWRSSGAAPLTFEHLTRFELMNHLGSIAVTDDDTILASGHREDLGGVMAFRVTGPGQVSSQTLLDVGQVGLGAPQSGGMVIAARGQQAAIVATIQVQEVVVGEHQRTLVFTTDDGGQTWTERIGPNALVDGEALPSEGVKQHLPQVAITANGVVHVATQVDLERSYFQIDAGTVTPMNLEAFASPGTLTFVGVAVSPNGQVVRLTGTYSTAGYATFTSLDGGETWDEPTFVNIGGGSDYTNLYVHDDGEQVDFKRSGGITVTAWASDAEAVQISPEEAWFGSSGLLLSVRTPQGDFWGTGGTGLGSLNTD